MMDSRFLIPGWLMLHFYTVPVFAVMKLLSQMTNIVWHIQRNLSISSILISKLVDKFLGTTFLYVKIVWVYVNFIVFSVPSSHLVSQCRLSVFSRGSNFRTFSRKTRQKQSFLAWNLHNPRTTSHHLRCDLSLVILLFTETL